MRGVSLVRRTGRLFLFIGGSLLLLAAWGLWRDIELIAQPFYAYAWWGYIFLLDGFCVLKRGHSLFTARRRFVIPLGLWSITFWFFFELLNTRFQNWYYVGVVPVRSLIDLLCGGTFVVLAFSTVFIGIFQTCEALSASGLWRNWRGEPGKLPGWVSYAIQALGLAMAVTAVLFPFYLAPLIWGSLSFMVDPWNYRCGRRSILRDLEARDWGVVARLFISGFICGLVWESLNYLAPQKWVYTVRGLEELKLFEMPLLGFLGFPALALDSMAAYSVLAAIFLGNESWEHPDDLSYTLQQRPIAPRIFFWGTVPMQVCFWAAVGVLANETSFGSLQLHMRDLNLEMREREVLERHGIRRPRQLLRAAPDAERFAEIQRELKWDDKRSKEILDRAELYTYKGIGSYYGLLLERVGVRHVSEFGAWDPGKLYERLQQEAEELEMRAPRLDMVRGWVFGAR